MKNNIDTALLIQRLTVGGLLLPHGLKKLEGIDVISQWVVNTLSLPEIFSYGVFLGEIVAPLFIIIGIWIRFSAFCIAITMIFSLLFLLTNGAPIFSFNQYGGLHAELNLFFLFSSISLFFSGPGKMSLKEKAFRY